MNMFGDSPHSATSRPYQVSAVGPPISNRPVNGPHISNTDAVSDTQIMLRWTVSTAATLAHLIEISFIYIGIYIFILYFFIELSYIHYIHSRKACRTPQWHWDKWPFMFSQYVQHVTAVSLAVCMPSPGLTLP